MTDVDKEYFAQLTLCADGHNTLEELPMALGFVLQSCKYAHLCLTVTLESDYKYLNQQGAVWS